MNKELIILIFLFALKKAESETSTEREIKNRILNSSSYDRLIRPEVTVSIYLQLLLKQLVSVDEKTQIITTSSLLIAIWRDERLQWNETEAGFDSMLIKSNLLWLPDLYAINTADTNGFITVSDYNIAVLTHEGYITVNFGLNGIFKLTLYKFYY